jgi:UDP-N-acetylenolpyruvoylglucosamine reductase
MGLTMAFESLCGIEIVEKYPLSKLTTFKVGGPVDHLIYVKTVDELKQVIQEHRAKNIPWLVLGRGSNLLVSDEGIEGSAVLLRGELSSFQIIDDTRIYCGAGMNLCDVSRNAALQNLTGLEFAVGIPGTFGGGIFMNAGAYDGELSQCIESVLWMNLEGQVVELATESCEFGYRQSFFQKNDGIILGATLKLSKMDKELVLTKMRDLTQTRNAKQPLEWPSAGSTFKRPPGYFAGTLIQEAGLQGFSLGGAQVSEKHAGFVVNKNSATAMDILHLIDEVQKKVYEYAGVWLIPEIRILGRGQEKWEYLHRPSLR